MKPIGRKIGKRLARGTLAAFLLMSLAVFSVSALPVHAGPMSGDDQAHAMTVVAVPGEIPAEGDDTGDCAVHFACLTLALPAEPGPTSLPSSASYLVAAPVLRPDIQATPLQNPPIFS